MVTATGAVLVWNTETSGEDIPMNFRQSFPSAIMQRPVVLSKRSIFAHRSVRVGWAIVPPAVKQAAISSGVNWE